MNFCLFLSNSKGVINLFEWPVEEQEKTDSLEEIVKNCRNYQKQSKRNSHTICMVYYVSEAEVKKKKEAAKKIQITSTLALA